LFQVVRVDLIESCQELIAESSFCTWSFMTFHIFSIMFTGMSNDCTGHVKPQKWVSVFHRWVKLSDVQDYDHAKRSAFQQNVCTHLTINVHRVHSYTVTSQYFCQLVLKYPLFLIKYSSRTFVIYFDCCCLSGHSRFQTSCGVLQT